jgi:acetyltransferase-like isoleucine patch superfamily enzyme
MRDCVNSRRKQSAWYSRVRPDFRCGPTSWANRCGGEDRRGGAGLGKKIFIQTGNPRIEYQPLERKPFMNPYQCIAPDVKLGRDVKLSKFINLYGCEIGDESKIGAFVEIQKSASIGKRCKISSHTFICEGVTVEDNVFIGHGVMFINDSYPRATAANGSLQTEADWKVERTVIRKGASIGSGATILSNITVGENAIVGAGSVVTKDVPANSIVAGNPAKFLRSIEQITEVSK